MKRIILFLLLPICLFLLYFIWTPQYFYTKAPECVNDISQLSNNELHTLLVDRRPADFRYFFNTFEIGVDTLMNVSFRNDTSCFNIDLDVDRWDKLSGMLKVNGKRYPKELYGLQWEVMALDDPYILHFVDMIKIID